MSGLVDETALTANGTRQGVAQVRIENELALPHLAAAVVSKARDASEMSARKYHHWLLHSCTGKAGHLGVRCCQKLDCLEILITSSKFELIR